MRNKNYWYYKSIGICTDCKKEKVTDGKTRCPKCREKHRIYHNSEFVKNKKKMLYQDLRDRGICVECKKEKAEGSKTRCKACAERKNAYCREYNRRIMGYGESIDEQLKGN